MYYAEAMSTLRYQKKPYEMNRNSQAIDIRSSSSSMKAIVQPPPLDCVQVPVKPPSVLPLPKFGIGSLSQYTNFEQIGEGSYGYVYRATDKRSGMQYALKKLIFLKENNGVCYNF